MRGRKETSLGHQLSRHTPIHGFVKTLRIDWARHELLLHRCHSKVVAVLYPKVPSVTLILSVSSSVIFVFPGLTDLCQVYLEKKYGPGAGSRMSAALGRAGALTGIRFNAERRVHNTMRSHRLVRLATKQGKGNEMIEQIFHGYFEEGRNIADVGVLLDLAEKVRALRRSEA